MKTKLHSFGELMLLIMLLAATIGEASKLQDIEYHYEPDRFSPADFTITDTIKGHVLKVGMSRDEIEALYGKSSEKTIFDYEVYGGLQVYYRDDIAVSFWVATYNNLINRYTTSRGVGLGDALSEVQQRYGDKFLISGKSLSSKHFTYRLRLVDGKVDPIDFDEPSWTLNEYLDELYILHFYFVDSPSERLDSFVIGDMRAVTGSG
ncbi:hypothetical protein ACF3MZ_10110 [Paenibacillaceae bacterium WGS1546]|uniref:hypothetical protein n=1 Tax=Cohnella sp. WGS1546 TaxID=3366810 RepID=UPI00372CF059